MRASLVSLNLSHFHARNSFVCKVSVQLLQLVDPDLNDGVARHTEITARGDGDGADLRAVREAAALKLL